MTKLISRAKLKAKLNRGEAFVLVDTLPEAAYRKHHLPGAINILSDDIVTVAPDRIPDRGAEIVVYCANGPCKRSRLRPSGWRRWATAGSATTTKAKRIGWPRACRLRGPDNDAAGVPTTWVTAASIRRRLETHQIAVYLGAIGLAFVRGAQHSASINSRSRPY